jgi:hypothetical protein
VETKNCKLLRRAGMDVPDVFYVMTCR